MRDHDADLLADAIAANTGGEAPLQLLLRDGDHFGELALLYNQPRSATIRTTASSGTICPVADRA